MKKVKDNSIIYSPLTSSSLVETPSAAEKRQNERSLANAELLPHMSRVICLPGSASAHHSGKAQKWWLARFLGSWEKRMDPGNSPDFTAITNISTIVQENLKKMKLVTSVKTLVQKPKRHGRVSMRRSSIAWCVTCCSACGIVSDCVVATLPKKIRAGRFSFGYKRAWNNRTSIVGHPVCIWSILEHMHML